MIRVVKQRHWHSPRNPNWMGQHDLFEDESAYGKGFDLDDLQSSLPAQNILWFYDNALI